MCRLIATISVFLFLTAHASAQLNRPPPGGLKIGQPPQDQSQRAQPETAGDQRGSATAPVIVKILPTPKTEKEARQEQSDRDDISSANWWMVRLTGAIGLIAFVQSIVFGLQARRLKQTIEKMEEIAGGQTTDMQASIRESGRAAVAMEGVAAGIAASVENTSRMAEDQRGFWRQQMRAYVSVRFGAVVDQNKITGIRFEPRMIVANTGHTPAHNVTYRANAEAMEFPLKQGFTFPLPEQTHVASAGMLAPQQTFIISAVVPILYEEADAGQIRNGIGRRIFVWGTVNYTDAFNVARYVNFSQHFLWLTNDTIMGYNTRRHNDAN